MCLILFAWRCHPQQKLLIAANRDEFYSRPATAAHFWQESPHILAGRDNEKGGTWLGVTRSGRFAAVTNVRKPGAAIGKISRGKLVQSFLDSNTSSAEFLQKLKASLPDYSPFNILASDGEQLHYSNSDGYARELQPGLYGLSNAELDAPWPKVVEGKQQLFNLIKNQIAQQAQIDSLFELLAVQEQADDEELPDTGIGMELEKKLSPRFIHMDGYGTRCSTIVTQSHDNRIQLWERQFGHDGQALNTVYHAL